MAVDGSSWNTINNNRFASLRNGGIYLYRNCGEKGTIRITPPEHNTITNNSFYYKKYTGHKPAIYLGSRDYGRRGKILLVIAVMIAADRMAVAVLTKITPGIISSRTINSAKGRLLMPARLDFLVLQQ